MPNCLIAGQQVYSFRVFHAVTLRWVCNVQATSFEKALEAAKKNGYPSAMVAIGLHHLYPDCE